MRQLLALVFGLLAVLAFSIPAAAQSLEGGCTVSASSDLDSTSVVDASQGDPFDIDPEGSISWNANSPGPITNHTWVINVELGGIDIPVADGGDPNTGESTSSVGSRSLPEIIEDVTARGAAGAGLLEDLSGVFHVSGEISGEGGACSGDAYVRILGNPLANPIGQAGAAATGVGALVTILSAFARKP